jgi:hypothetical protein
MTNSDPTQALLGNNPEVVYEDSYIRVFQDRIQIFHYYFPIGTSKTIYYSDIEWVKTDEEMKLGVLQFKAWGMGLANIWWPLDFHRSPCVSGKSPQLIIKLKGWSTCAGASCWKNPDMVEYIKTKVASLS